ncbi:SNF2 family N-terminal domain-containing protein [Zopfochytrium polystomum]|nr:SNF2 family N-terminal domain-containing protein [Zopfochytrium polystomum]
MSDEPFPPPPPPPPPPPKRQSPSRTPPEAAAAAAAAAAAVPRPPPPHSHKRDQNSLPHTPPTRPTRPTPPPPPAHHLARPAHHHLRTDPRNSAWSSSSAAPPPLPRPQQGKQQQHNSNNGARFTTIGPTHPSTAGAIARSSTAYGQPEAQWGLLVANSAHSQPGSVDLTRNSRSNASGAPSGDPERPVSSGGQPNLRREPVPIAIPTNPKTHREPGIIYLRELGGLSGLPPAPYNAYKPVEATDIHELINSISSAEDIQPANAQPDDLVSTLKPYQLQGLSWLLDRESGKHRGGILADDMGLGKTVQTISLLLANRSPSNASDRKTTLIVTPLPLLRQWESEISLHTKKGSLSVYVHHGPRRTKDVTRIQSYDVVLTTLAVLTGDLPKDKAKRPSTSKKEKSSSIFSSAESRKVNDEDNSEDGHDSDDSLENADGIESSEDEEPSAVKRKEKSRRSVGGKAVSELGVLLRCKFLRMVIDEAHVIKNRKTRGFAACCKVDAVYRLCLTGTPIQNSVEELQSLFEFLQLRPYNDLSTFKMQIGRPLQSGQKIGMDRLRLVLKAVMLRRTKASVFGVGNHTGGETSGSIAPAASALQLPEKKILRIPVDLTDREKKFYQLLETVVRRRVKQYLKDAESKTATLLTLLLRLRQACNHPCMVGGLVDPDAASLVSGVNKADSVDVELESMLNLFQSMQVRSPDERTACACCMTPLPAKGPLCDNCKAVLMSYPNPAVLGQKGVIDALRSSWVSSTKIDAALNILGEGLKSKPSDKWIVFSQFTSLLDIIEIPLTKQHCKFVRYDGSMPNNLREKSLTAFKEDSSVKVCLISLMCGSLGLNLTSANNVILFDVWWNPMIEDQAVDRVYRIGQTKPVNVYKLTAEGTIENRVVALQEKKRELVNGALGSQAGNVKMKLSFVWTLTDAPLL